MKLVEVSENQKDLYNQFVADSPTGSFLQSWEWGSWQEKLGRQVNRFFLKNDNEDNKNSVDSIIGSIQLIKMPLPLGKYYLYAPYGPVGDLKLKIEDLGLELQKKFPGAIFFRVEPICLFEGLSDGAKKTVNIQPAITMVVELNKQPEEILALMHPKTRYNIKLAQKHGVLVQSELVVTPGHGLYFKEAIDLIIETQIRQQYRGHNQAYYRNLIDFFSSQQSLDGLRVRIYKVLFGRQLLASGVMVDFGKTRMYLYGGSSEIQRNLMAPYLMHWQAIQDAKFEGLERYDLGGSEVSSGGEKGFTRFKQGFGGKVVNYSGAYDIVCRPLLYQSYKFARLANKIIKK